MQSVMIMVVSYKTIRLLEELLACLGVTAAPRLTCQVGLAKDRDRPAAKERAVAKDFILSRGVALK